MLVQHCYYKEGSIPRVSAIFRLAPCEPLSSASVAWLRFNTLSVFFSFLERSNPMLMHAQTWVPFYFSYLFCFAESPFCYSSNEQNALSKQFISLIHKNRFYSRPGTAARCWLFGSSRLDRNCCIMGPHSPPSKLILYYYKSVFPHSSPFYNLEKRLLINESLCDSNSNHRKKEL